MAWRYYTDQEHEPYTITWRNQDGAIIDFGGTDYDFVLQLVTIDTNEIVLEKLTGIEGDDEAPNVTVTWDEDELDLAPGTYLARLVATNATGDAVYDHDLIAIIGAPVDESTATPTWPTLTEMIAYIGEVRDGDVPILQKRLDAAIDYIGWRCEDNIEEDENYVDIIAPHLYEATQELTARLFRRRLSPGGVEGIGDFGPVRITRVDPDIERMLTPSMSWGFA